MKTWFQKTKAERQAIKDRDQNEREIKRRVNEQRLRLIAQRKRTLSSGSGSVVVPPPSKRELQ